MTCPSAPTPPPHRSWAPRPSLLLSRVPTTSPSHLPWPATQPPGRPVSSCNSNRCSHRIWRWRHISCSRSSWRSSGGNLEFNRRGCWQCNRNWRLNSKRCCWHKRHCLNKFLCRRCEQLLYSGRSLGTPKHPISWQAATPRLTSTTVNSSTTTSRQALRTVQVCQSWGRRRHRNLSNSLVQLTSSGCVSRRHDEKWLTQAKEGWYLFIHITVISILTELKH